MRILGTDSTAAPQGTGSSAPARQSASAKCTHSDPGNGRSVHTRTHGGIPPPGHIKEAEPGMYGMDHMGRTTNVCVCVCVLCVLFGFPKDKTK